MPACVDSVRVTDDDLQFLWDGRLESKSNYHGVYEDKTPGTFQARFFQKKICSGRPTPREAAIALVRRWKATFGADWRSAWYYRQTQGWTTLRDAGGWWGCVEIVGEAVVLIGRHPEWKWAAAVQDTPGCKPFPSEAAARKGIVRWAKRLWGRDRRYVVRRTYCAGRNAARVVGVSR